MGDHVRRVPATTESGPARHARQVVIVGASPAGATMTAALAAAGFEIVDARQTRDVHPAAIVLAVTGPDDLPVLAELTAGGTAPVVVIADDASPELVAGVRDAGAQALLPAPAAATALVPAVELAIARHADITRLRTEIATARRSLENRKLIDRAKGLLMTHRGMSEPEAFRWIQRTAMDRRKSSGAVAAQIIAEHERSAVPAAS